MRMQNRFVLALRCIAPVALVAWAVPVTGQYRRQVEELEPAYAVTASAGALASFVETTSPVETPAPEDPRRGRRDVETMPAVSLSARYGRGIAVYGAVTAAFPGEAGLSGNDPLTGASLDGTTEVGTILMYSAGMSFVPLRNVRGLRFAIGPSWIDLGSGGSYLAVRAAATAKFLAIGDDGGLFLGWDGYFAGGQHDRGGIEYQVRGGLLSSVRAGFEYAW